jgi:hypothetical protein
MLVVGVVDDGRQALRRQEMHPVILPFHFSRFFFFLWRIGLSP